uniref:Cytochrome P450 2U1 n=1 Tax=Macrostomum lignano TaxID=282301 RepID=A0A1I8FAG5_9PLAT
GGARPTLGVPLLGCLLQLRPTLWDAGRGDFVGYTGDIVQLPTLPGRDSMAAEELRNSLRLRLLNPGHRGIAASMGPSSDTLRRFSLAHAEGNFGLGRAESERRILQEFEQLRALSFLPTVVAISIPRNSINKAVALVTLRFLFGDLPAYDSQGVQPVPGGLEHCAADSPAELFNDDQLAYCLADLFIAGSDTTTNTLLWSLLLMAVHPEVQDAGCTASWLRGRLRPRLPNMRDRPLPALPPTPSSTRQHASYAFSRDLGVHQDTGQLASRLELIPDTFPKTRPATKFPGRPSISMAVRPWPASLHGRGAGQDGDFPVSSLPGMLKLPGEKAWIPAASPARWQNPAGQRWLA